MEDFSLDTSLSSLNEQQINDFKSFLREGTYFLRDKNWKNGEKCFSEALKINYDSYEANLGKLFCKLKISSFAEKSRINNVTKLKEFVNTYNSANNTDKIHLLQWVEENSKFVRTKRLKVFLTTISCFVVTIALALATFLVVIPRVYYYKAVNAIEQKDYLSAYENLQHSYIYKNSAELLKNFELLQIKNAQIGDTVFIGISDKWQDNYKYRWEVIAKEGNEILLLSTYTYTSSETSFYNNLSPYTPSTYDFSDTETDYIGGWADSGIRKELNNKFYSHFAEEIKSRILTKTLIDCEDKLLILSEEEINKYLPTEDAKSADNYYILRNVSDNTYSIVEKDGSISKFKFTHLPDINDDNNDGLVEASQIFDFLKKYKKEITNNKYIKGAYYRPAMWVDISNIDL